MILGHGVPLCPVISCDGHGVWAWCALSTVVAVMVLGHSVPLCHVHCCGGHCAGAQCVSMPCPLLSSRGFTVVMSLPCDVR